VQLCIMEKLQIVSAQSGLRALHVTCWASNMTVVAYKRNSYTSRHATDYSCGEQLRHSCMLDLCMEHP